MQEYSIIDAVYVLYNEDVINIEESDVNTFNSLREQQKAGEHIGGRMTVLVYKIASYNAKELAEAREYKDEQISACAVTLINFKENFQLTYKCA